MAYLKLLEKKILESFLEMKSGYVLNFSDRTFSQFFQELNFNINSPIYSEGNSGSKANKLRKLIEIESNESVSNIIKELVNYAKSYRLTNDNAAECLLICDRLARNNDSRPNTINRIVKNNMNNHLNRPIEIFFSYAHEDEALMNQVRQQLVIRERMGQIIKWHDRMIPAGDNWREHIDNRIQTSDVILLFMSPDFLESRYCYEIEAHIALQRHNDGNAKVIPIILRACDWTVTPFGEIQALPRDGKPITQWPDRDQVSLDIARSIMDAIS